MTATPPTPPDDSADPQSRDPRTAQDQQFNFDLRRRLVQLAIHRPLELEPIVIEIPMLVWKEVAAQIIIFEVNAERQRAQRPPLIQPGG